MARNRFGVALRVVRLGRGLAQEEFGDVSGRTYISNLERDLHSPTLEKIEELAEVLKVHPLTLILLAYCETERLDQVTPHLQQLTEQIAGEIDAMVRQAAERGVDRMAPVVRRAARRTSALGNAEDSDSGARKDALKK